MQTGFVFLFKTTDCFEHTSLDANNAKTKKNFKIITNLDSFAAKDCFENTSLDARKADNDFQLVGGIEVERKTSTSCLQSFTTPYTTFIMARRNCKINK